MPRSRPAPAQKRPSYPARPSALPDPADLASLLAFDVETSGLAPDDGSRVSVVSLAFRLKDDPQLHNFAYPFGQGPDDAQVDLGAGEWRTCLDWIRAAGTQTGLVGHNANFDVIQLRAGAKPGYAGEDFNDLVVFDTMAAADRIFPGESKALKSIAVRLFGEDADAEQRSLRPHLGPKTNPRYDRVPWEVMRPYALRDTELTLQLLEWYFDPAHPERFVLNPQSAYVQRELDVARALVRMEVAGLPYDPEASYAAASELELKIAKLRDELPFVPTIPKTKSFYFAPSTPALDLGKGLVAPLALRPRATTAKGAPRLTAEDLTRMVARQIPHAETLQRIRRYESANSKWYRAFADRANPDDGRIRTQFRQFGTATGEDGGTRSGRFSVGRINLQAVPKDYALHLPVPTPRALIARAAASVPGWSLYDLDLAQAELRTAALDAQCETMLDAIRNGRDAHGETAHALFGTPPDHPDFKVNRQIAKRALPLDAPVLTPQGFRLMGDIQVGDVVVGPDGAPTRVLAIPFEGEGEVWEVRTRSGATAFCDADHLWNVRRRRSEGYDTITTRQLAEEVAANRHRSPALPIFLDENTPDRDFPVHPYVLGALLGDGSIPASGQGTPKLHSLKSDRYIADRCGELSGDTVREATRKDVPNMGRYHFLGNRVRTGCRELGILGVRGKDKRVPEEYFHGSAEQRLELLRGLMDTDGSAAKRYHNIFSNTSRQLIDAVVRLVRSLGGVATVNEAYRPPHGRWSPSWYVHIRMPEGRNPYSLPRKSELWKPNRVTDAVVHAAPTGRREPVKCITVDRPDGLFVTNDYLVTHNCNFSLIFGSGPPTFQAMVERESDTSFSLAEARRVVYGWRDLYPEFGKRIDHWMEFARHNGYVPLSNGKHRYFAPGEDWHKAFNQRIQGSLAEYAKEWLLSTDSLLRPYHDDPDRTRNPARYGGLLLVVHDSQVLFLPDDDAPALISRIQDDARAIWARWFPGVPGDVDATPWG